MFALSIALMALGLTLGALGALRMAGPGVLAPATGLLLLAAAALRAYWQRRPT